MAARRAIDRKVRWDDAERVEAPRAAPTPQAIQVGSVNDPAEAQADRMADRALALAAEYSGGRPDAPMTGSVQRSASADVDGLSVSESALSAANSGGRPLDARSRTTLEQGFGTDLGAVRVHTGPQSAAIARDIHAKAFTHGSDVHFGAGEYRPGTPAGDRVLAHEVAHTVQSDRAADVHRFPTTWNTSPVPWKGMTSSVFRPGEGASGGVYILTSKDEAGPVKKAVAKPVFGTNGLNLRESGEQLQFSDSALAKLLGLKAPESKVVKKGGTEFSHLVEVCRTKQPPPQPGEQQTDLATAESFVVMSEVPDASSIGSLADRARTDGRASADLFRAVFDPVFLAELGKVCIGDVMLGNPDRIVLGAMNLGNVMVSMQNDRFTLAAIDTTTYLPAAVKPNDWVQGWQRGRSEMQDGPGVTLDGFFRVLVDRLKNGAPDDGRAMPAWKLIETTYQTHRDRILADFDFGWTSALITALAFADDDNTINSLTAGYKDQDVSAAGLKANLQYLGAQAQGKTHEESIGRAMAITGSAWAATLDLDRVRPPADALQPRSAIQPGSKAVTAEVVAMPSLPKADEVAVLPKKDPVLLYANQLKMIDAFNSKIANARSEIDQQVSATKSKRSKPFGRKEDVPRNRSVVSHYVAHATAMSVGGARAADAALFLNKTLNDVKPLTGADFHADEAAHVRKLLNRLGAGIPEIAVTLSRYKHHLDAAAAIVPRTRHGESQQLAEVARAAGVYIDEATKMLAKAKSSNPAKMASQLNVTH